MADGFQAKADTRGVLGALNGFVGPLAKHLARSMAVAGGTVLRDEAKLLAPVGGDMSVDERLPGESNTPGLLRDAIYLAYKQDRELSGSVTYSVSWNATTAPHGHLLEFGHWRIYAVYKGENGEWYTNKNVRLAEPKWVPAHPFMRPAYDSASARAQAAMITRGKERFPELLRNAYQPPDEDFV